MMRWNPLKKVAVGLAAVAISAAPACTETPTPKPTEVAPRAEKAPKQSKPERQTELIAKADAELNAGELEPAIAAYLDAERLGPLGAGHARKFAAALKQNGGVVVAAGEDVPRGMTNYVKALTLDPGLQGLVGAMVEAADKLDTGDGLRAEQVIDIYLEENKPALTEAANATLGEFFRANAERLLDQPWAGLRIYRNLQRADDLSPKTPELEATWKQAAAKLDEELAAGLKIKKAVDAQFRKHPGEDGIEAVAKRRQMTVDDVTSAVELVAWVEEDQKKQLAKECGPKPSCGGLDGGCQADESAFKDDVEVSSCTKPRLVEGKCWVVQCDVKAERTGMHLGRYELNYKAVQGVPMPVGAARVGG